jgi:hypothetical protein
MSKSTSHWCGRWGLLTCAAIVFSIWNLGCTRTDNTNQQTSGPTAEQILVQMVQKYAEADSYQDRATLRLSYQLEGRPIEENFPLEIQWQRKQGFACKWFKSRLSGDQEQVVCRVIDIPTNNMDGQTVFQTRGSVGTFDTIFEDTIARHFICGSTDLPWAPDVQENPNDQISPIWALLTNEHKPLWLRSHNGLTRLNDDKIADQNCYRISVDTLLGEYVVWIDAKTFLLRRLIIPQGVMARELNQTQVVSGIEIVADFDQAEFKADLTTAIAALKVRENEKPTRYFVTLPEEFPSSLIGHRVRDFQLHALRGSDVGRDDLKNQISVFLWFSGVDGEKVCKAFNEVAHRFVRFDDVRCFGVCSDPESIASDQAVAQRVGAWQLNYPVTRDLIPCGESVFDIQLVPTIVVLGPDNRMQFYATADNDNVIQDAIAAIDRLKQGDDIAAEMHAQYEDYLTTYQKQLAVANPFRKVASVNTLEVKLRRATQPQRIKLKQLWTSEELVAPGNLTVADVNGQTHLFAHDGWRTIVELDLQGNTIARHPLDLPADAAVAWLRTGKDTDGQTYFAACSMMDRRLFVFDQSWKLRFVYPQSSSELTGIADLRFIDGDAQQPARLLVAMHNEQGVRMLDLDGTLIAQSPRIDGTTSLALVTLNDNQLGILAANESGKATLLNEELQPISATLIEQSDLRYLFDGKLKNAAIRSLLSLGDHGEFALQATIHSEIGAPVGSLELVPGAFQDQVQFACYGDPLHDLVGAWVIARPDSTVYLISARGNLIDSFQYGKAIRGINVTVASEQGMLLVSTADGIEAWQIQRAATTASLAIPQR